jgi:hypothetical protein
VRAQWPRPKWAEHTALAALGNGTRSTWISRQRPRRAQVVARIEMTPRPMHKRHGTTKSRPPRLNSTTRSGPGGIGADPLGKTGLTPRAYMVVTRVQHPRCYPGPWLHTYTYDLLSHVFKWRRRSTKTLETLGLTKEG